MRNDSVSCHVEKLGYTNGEILRTRLYSLSILPHTGCRSTVPWTRVMRRESLKICKLTIFVYMLLNTVVSFVVSTRISQDRDEVVNALKPGKGSPSCVGNGVNT